MKTKTGIKLKFGDVIINHWAGERNPNRKLIVISIGKHINCMNKKGENRQLINDKHTEIKVIGNIIDLKKFDELTLDYSISDQITTDHHKNNPILFF